MKCKIDGCERDAMYKKQQVCQKHYFRKMRYGTYNKKKPQDRLDHSDGYVYLRKPEHILSNSRGYVYEHRYVYYENISKDIYSCSLCGKEIGWGNAHIDHIDENRQNNSVSNLRPLCQVCNTTRNRDTTKEGMQFAYNGKTQNAGAWAKEDFINVSRNTIVNRRKSGMSDEECLTARKITHKSS